MGGTSEVAYWEQDGMYLSQTVGATAIALGTVVEMGSTDGYVITASSASTMVLGVAIAGYRASRTATDNTVAAGGLVTVATRGIVNLGVATGTVTRGDFVEVSGTDGKIKTSATSFSTLTLGQAITTGTVTVKVKLMKG